VRPARFGLKNSKRTQQIDRVIETLRDLAQVSAIQKTPKNEIERLA
jgi:hypothetical protein